MPGHKDTETSLFPGTSKEGLMCRAEHNARPPELPQVLFGQRLGTLLAVDSAHTHSGVCICSQGSLNTPWHTLAWSRREEY